MKSRTTVVVALACAIGLAGTGLASAQTGNAVLERPDGIYLRCDQCGTVAGIEQNVTRGGGHGTAGAVVGAIAGGLLGNQIGKGKGRTIATIGGVVGGGAAGNAIGNSGSRTSWLVRIRMGSGNFMNVEVPDASALRVGDLVEVDPQGQIVRIR